MAFACAQGAGGTAKGGLSAEKADAADIAVEGVAISSLNRHLATEAAALAAMATDADAEAGAMTLNSIRVVWSREEEELYKEVLRQHGRSMARLSAAFPAKCAPLTVLVHAPVMSVSACRFVIARHI